MKKSRGQSLIEFVMIAILAVGIIVFGLYKYGDNLANFFAGSNPEKRFNNSRTVKFENPQDLVSNVSITIDGMLIEPPVEKIIKAGLASGTYIQTSGSAGRIAEMSKIMEEYVYQIQQLVNSAGGAAQQTALNTALDSYKSSITNVGGTGFLDVHNALANNALLEQKLNMLKMAIDLDNSSVISDIGTKFTAYTATLVAGNRKSIVETLTNDMMGFGNYVDYFIDPYLYTQYLKEEKRVNDKVQDQNLLAALNAAVASMTAEEKLNKAGLIKIFYGAGYSQTSPAAYNGERMCNTFSGVMVSETQCEIPVP